MNNKVRALIEVAKIVLFGGATGLIVSALIYYVGIQWISLGLVAFALGWMLNLAYKLKLDELNALDKLNKRQ